MATDTVVHGKQQECKLNGVVWRITKTSLTAPVPKKVEATDSGSGGWQEIMKGGGIKAMNGSLELFYDTAKNLDTDASLALDDGEHVTFAIRLHPDAPLYSGKAYIDEVKTDAEVSNDTPIKVSCNFSSHGVITVS